MHAFFRAENVSASQKAQFTAEHLPEPVMSPNEAARGSIDRFDLYPARLLGDSAYGSAEMLGWLVYEHGIGHGDDGPAKAVTQTDDRGLRSLV
jgi:hypothetical protein